MSRNPERRGDGPENWPGNRASPLSSEDEDGSNPLPPLNKIPFMQMESRLYDGGKMLSAECIIRKIPIVRVQPRCCTRRYFTGPSASFVGLVQPCAPPRLPPMPPPPLGACLHTRGTYLSIQGFEKVRGGFAAQKSQTEAGRLGVCLAFYCAFLSPHVLKTGLPRQFQGHEECDGSHPK